MNFIFEYSESAVFLFWKNKKTNKKLIKDIDKKIKFTKLLKTNNYGLHIEKRQ